MRSLPSSVHVSLFLSITIGMSPARAVTSENERAAAYEEIYHRMNRLGQERNLAALEAIAQEIEQRWGETDLEMYASCMRKLSCELGGRIFKEKNKAFGLSQTLAMKALKKSDQIPLELECKLVSCLPAHHCDVNGNRLVGQDLAQMRYTKLRLRLHAWQRLEKTIDENWDPNDLPCGALLPPGVSGMAGGDPRHIEDPQLRAQYVAAIEASRKKTEKYNEQTMVRGLMIRWVREAQKAIIFDYMQPPDAKDELIQLLDEYGIGAETRTMLLDAVEKKEIPKQLEFTVTTQPATRPE